jgi:hypothetical protein
MPDPTNALRFVVESRQLGHYHANPEGWSRLGRDQLGAPS